jgi:hypothetical protein
LTRLGGERFEHARRQGGQRGLQQKLGWGRLQRLGVLFRRLLGRLGVFGRGWWRLVGLWRRL